VITRAVAITTALTDFLFWDGYFGVSVGIFFAALGYEVIHPTMGLLSAA